MTLQVIGMPANDNRKLRRYMNMEKFSSLVGSKSIYHARADRFLDPYEGYLPGLSVAQERGDGITKFHEGFDLIRGEELLRHAFVLRRLSYVSCWHADDHESDAMWRLYVGAPEGVAVVTSVAKLAQCFTEFRDHNRVNGMTSFDGFLGAVTYIDPREERTVESSELLLCKRKGFDFEREVRLIVRHDRRVEGNSWSLPLGHSLASVIEEVVVSPQATDAFWERIVDMTPDSVRVRRSSLHGAPDWGSVSEAGEKYLRFLWELAEKHSYLFPPLVSERQPKEKSSVVDP